MSQAGTTISLHRLQRNWEALAQLTICLDTVEINEVGQNQSYLSVWQRAKKATMSSDAVEWRISAEEARWFPRETASDAVTKTKNKRMEKETEQKRKTKKQEVVSRSVGVL